MCWSCVEEAGGDKVVLTEEHKAISQLIRDWYQAPDMGEDGYPMNGCGGGLHCQLDDFNLDDYSLTYEWTTRAVWDTEARTWSNIRVSSGYSEPTLRLGHQIVAALQSMTEAERHAVVWHANVYDRAL